MSVMSGVSEFIGLDIGTTAVRVVELRGGGPVKQLYRYGATPVDSRVAMSDAPGDQQKLMQVVRELMIEAKISEKNVAVNVPSGRVFTTVFDIDKLSPSELEKSIQLQADSLIPTPLSESKIDFEVIGDSPKEKGKVEVLLTSVTNGYVEKRLDALESIGLNVISFEPDNLALARSLLAQNEQRAQMILDVGYKNTDLVIVSGGYPRLTRAIPTGSEAIIRAAAQNLSIEDKQAEQFVFKFGLSKDKLEGQIYNSISGTVDIIATEIEKSIKYFQQRYNTNLERIIVTGSAATLPEFPLYIANRFGINIEIGNAWRNVSYSKNQQQELMNLSSNFGVAVGLAERKE
ncbi:MAG: pilus assembly protein PilM [bacterium]|nr:pilus assembly protein PilM [bacterium]